MNSFHIPDPIFIIIKASARDLMCPWHPAKCIAFSMMAVNLRSLVTLQSAMHVDDAGPQYFLQIYFQYFRISCSALSYISLFHFFLLLTEKSKFTIPPKGSEWIIGLVYYPLLLGAATPGVAWDFFFFLSAVLISTLTLLIEPTSSVSLPYFIQSVPLRKCLGKHSCMSSLLPYWMILVFFALWKQWLIGNED